MLQQSSCGGPFAGLPPAFLDRMSHLLGDAYPAFLASYQQPPAVGLRVNTLKILPDAFRALAPFDLTPLDWPEGAFLAPEQARAGRHPYHAAGLYYLQEPSAMAVAALMAPQPGERVLDLAAAPGGKATHIAALMAGRGLLLANEVHPKRCWDLAENLERWGATNVAIVRETPDRLAQRFPARFDRVLLDAPCSGEGMLRKSAAARLEWSPELVTGCAARQLGILDHAAQMVRPGGRLVYATCTFAPEENEGTVSRFLRRHPDYEMLPVKRPPGATGGRPDWLPPGERSAAVEHSVRLWPHLGPGEGHFIAVMRRQEGTASRERFRPAGRPEPLPRQAWEAYCAFCAANLTAAGDSRRTDEPLRLALEGAYLYALPPDLPPVLSGLRYVHPGWWLGTIKGGRFEPSHALALGLRREDALRSLDLPAASAEVLAYLRGESLSSAGESGWVLVTVDGYPLGWGKRTGGLVKSRYPRGLRWGGPR